MEYPNQGTMWHNTEKKFDKAPDFAGSVIFERELLEQLISESTNGEVEIKLDGWKGKVNTKNGERNVLRVKLNAWKPKQQSSSPAKDPWDE
jgi:hypothetical protein